MGSSSRLRYNTVYVAWNAFLRLMEINYPQCFSCPICKDSPDTIILDGVTLGTIRELPRESSFAETNISQYVPISRRIWVSNPRVRKSLRTYAKDGLSLEEYNILLANLEPEAFQVYVGNSSSSTTIGGNVIYRPGNPKIKFILKHLSSNEPLLGIFQFSILSEKELLLFSDLANNYTRDMAHIENLYAKMVNFKPLFESYEFDVLPFNSLRLHPIVSGLLISFIQHIEYLYTFKTSKPLPIPIQQNLHEYFPGLKQYRYVLLITV